MIRRLLDYTAHMTWWLALQRGITTVLPRTENPRPSHAGSCAIDDPVVQRALRSKQREETRIGLNFTTMENQSREAMLLVSPASFASGSCGKLS